MFPFCIILSHIVAFSIHRSWEKQEFANIAPQKLGILDRVSISIIA
jgi:hypothetical protein